MHGKSTVTPVIVCSSNIKTIPSGVARIFQRGGHTESNIIVMAFSPRNIVGCLLKKGLQRGSHGHPMQDPPSLRP